MPAHYLSTACYHGKHGKPCRNTCKFCDAPCWCPCHAEDSTGQQWPESWVDQARAVARALFSVISPADVPDELGRRISADPALFWLRDDPWPEGRFQPEHGTWHEDEG